MASAPPPPAIAPPASRLGKVGKHFVGGTAGFLRLNMAKRDPRRTPEKKTHHQKLYDHHERLENHIAQLYLCEFSILNYGDGVTPESNSFIYKTII